MEDKMRRSCLVLGLTLLGAHMLAAQTKLSGEGTCSDPEVAHALPVGDRPNHNFTISQTKCSWTKPFEIGGTKAIAGTGVQFDESSGNTARFHGYYRDRMSSGDTVTYRYQGVSSFRGGVPQSAGWTWMIHGGTGKLNKLQGRGSCKGSWNTAKVYTFRCDGEYRLVE
jgi:hypothetical protein